MLLLFIVCLMKLIEMYSVNNNGRQHQIKNKSSAERAMRNKCLRNAKENQLNGGVKLQNNGHFEMLKSENVMKTENRFPMNYFHDIDQSCVDQLKEYLKSRQSGINSYRGMNEFTNQPAAAVVKTKLIKSGLLSQQNHQQAGFQARASPLKQPLSSLSTNNNILNNQTNNNNNNNNCYYGQQRHFPARAVQQPSRYQRHDLKELSEDALKSDVQIVLNNIQNAFLNQQQQQQHEDRFQYWNAFDQGSPSSIRGNNVDLKQVRKLHAKKMSASPADCDNANNNMGPTSMLGCSFASDFTHDNSDYQWFIDYGYRDGVQHHSILSSLSASYNGIGELSYYDDLARNIDANLAEVDMENFRSEDIHSLLQMRQDDMDGLNNPTRLSLKDPNELLLENSICKSEILFSPVKESHISVDSLDMDGYPDDIILTCQANKNNYTIAFEGSCMYSDESYYDIPDNGRLKHNSINLDNMLNNKKTIDGDMTQSDTGYTTWSQLKKSNDHINIQRYPSGNNNNNSENTANCNTNINNTINNNNNNSINTCTHYLDINVRRSSSMPNLKAILQQQQQQQQHQQNNPQSHHLNLNVSEIASSQSSMDTESKMKTMLQMYPAPIASSESDSPAPNCDNDSSSNNERVANPPSLNLVKLFIKQKSSSSDTCMDVSSGCWPSDSTNSSTEHPGNCANSSLSRLRKKSMNDSGKFSALSKHEEDAEYQLDSLDAQHQQQGGERKTNDFNREIFDSPTHRRHYRDCALNIRNQMKNPLLFNVINNNGSGAGGSRSQSETSRTSENLTQILKQDEKVTVPIDMFTKSIQTSSILMSNVAESSKKLPQSHVTMVPPSFLSQLSKLGDQQQAPVYVIYPNYALPDLEFINAQPTKLRKEIIVSPLSYQQPKMARTLDLKARPASARRRPQSLDIDRLQQNQYDHVQDWKSLLTLLPRDYKKLLKGIPEVSRIASMEASISSQKPLFCMTPSIRRTTAGLICDCQTLLQNQTANSSSSGGSSQKASSGYRGSSTMLTDSEMEELINGGSGCDAMRNMFVYQYDNVPDLEQRPPPGGASQRRGILRRTNTTTNTPTRVTNASSAQKQKRYSMLDQPKSPQQQLARNHAPSSAAQQEKRRSLQEPDFYHHNDLEDYFNNIGIGGTKNFANRLPNYMKTRDDHRDVAKDLNQLLTELELNKALSSKLNGAEVGDLQEIEARLKDESFLNAIPKSELKNYANIAQILEWNQTEGEPTSEKSKLRNEVSKTLSSRKVSFNHPTPTPASPVRSAKSHSTLHAPDYEKKFTTPPNSPQMSQLVDKKSPVDKKQQHQQRLEKEKQDKIQSNRFKRLQIQWELLSKEQPPVLETKSNVTTPTGVKCQSKIPRPVSYPNPKTQNHELAMGGGRGLKSPSRMATPKKYTTTPTNITSPTAINQQTPRTPNKQLHTTPKKTLPARSATRTR